MCRTYSKANHLTDILLDMNAQVLAEFKELSDAATRNLPELRPENTMAGHVKRSGGLLPFIGDLSKSLFNTATMDDVERIARKINQIVARGNKFGNTLVHHEANFQSYIATNDHRVVELSDLVLDNHDLMMEVQNETSRVFKRMERTSEAIIGE